MRVFTTRPSSEVQRALSEDDLIDLKIQIRCMDKLRKLADPEKQYAAERVRAERRKIKIRASFTCFLNNAITKAHSNVKARAKLQTMINDLTHEEGQDIFFNQFGLCAQTHQLMNTDKGSLNMISIDRKNSDLGYTKKNVQFVTVFYNKGKGEANDAEACMAMFGVKKLSKS